MLGLILGAAAIVALAIPHPAFIPLALASSLTLWQEYRSNKHDQS